jgi:AraC-like DNA-binding protein
MTILFEERASDSPYVALVQRGRTARDGRVLRPTESHWHMVLLRYKGETRFLVVGPWTTTGVLSYPEGAELLWIKLKPGTFLPHLPARHILNKETPLPQATSNTFWLHGSTWQFPDYDNVETFIERLTRQEALVCDPVVSAALQDQPQALSPRTIRHRFLQATGMTQSHIRQIDRARRAETLLRQGMSILDTVYEAGYFDQPHLTRALKQWIGYTPTQIIRTHQPGCVSEYDQLD